MRMKIIHLFMIKGISNCHIWSFELKWRGFSLFFS